MSELYSPDEVGMQPVPAKFYMHVHGTARVFHALDVGSWVMDEDFVQAEGRWLDISYESQEDRENVLLPRKHIQWVRLEFERYHELLSDETLEGVEEFLGEDPLS